MGKKERHRGHNEGSIYQRASDGLWVASISVGPGGKRKVFYGKTRAEVARKLNEGLQKQAQNLPVAYERQTVGQFLDHWLADVVKPNLAYSTYKSYAGYCRNHITPELGRFQLAKLTPQQVQAFLNSRLAAGLSPRTVQYQRAILRRALGQALNWGLVSRNVARLVEPPKSKRYEPVFLTATQAEQLLTAIRGDRLEALTTVALSLALRQGEALGLRWSDVDFEAGTIQVAVQLQRIEGKLHLVDLKTARSRRTVHMPPTIARALREHRTRQLEERLLAGSRWHGEWDLVFMSTIGTPLSARNVVRHFKRILERAGLPDMRWYDLRHSGASFLIAQGVHPRAIMDLLGHSQIHLTMNTYGHIADEMRRDVASAMERIINPELRAGEGD